ncbi:helix-turn-helix transcriptional regulator [Cellulomonas aerilata]|uniref:Protein PafB n=1 Tax=Cellulomonas aerilata TaxID=515326 RepID=A0A512DAD9_9CELL|nr:WYL domain-containing protein [Cellulomonas aerilata]GEO33443.1 protein PafB [Cellulomonas aerilata]
MPEQTHPAERLLNLVIALVNTANRMTKEQIRSSVAGYADATSDDAFERMFERDKDSLRELGIPVLTVAGSGHSDDVGYRIDQEAYALRPVDLTAAELGVLSLAVQFWQDKALRTDAARALTKLRAVGSAPAGTDLVAGLAPRVRPAGDAFGPLLDAIGARQAVTFTYRAANTGEVRDRTLEPWRLLARGGGWYVVGRDTDRGAPRSFRLSRIQGRVRTTGAAGAYDIPADVDAAAVVGDRHTEPTRLAVLALRPERASALRARGVAADPTDDPDVADPRSAAALADRDVVRVPFGSASELADELAGYADAVVVLGPDDLRAQVLQRLRAAAALDRAPGEAPPGTPPGAGAAATVDASESEDDRG